MTSDPSDSHCAGNPFQVNVVVEGGSDVNASPTSTVGVGSGDKDDEEVEDEEADQILPLRYRRLFMPYPPSVNRVSDAMRT